MVSVPDAPHGTLAGYAQPWNCRCTWCKRAALGIAPDGVQERRPTLLSLAPEAAPSARAAVSGPPRPTRLHPAHSGSRGHPAPNS